MYNIATKRVILTRDVFKWADWHGYVNPAANIPILLKDAETVAQGNRGTGNNDDEDWHVVTFDDEGNVEPHNIQNKLPVVQADPDDFVEVDDDDENQQVEVEENVAPKPRLSREARALAQELPHILQGQNVQGRTRGDAGRIAEQLNLQGQDDQLDDEYQINLCVLQAAMEATSRGEPATYKEVMEMKNDDKSKWIKAITKELTNFDQHKVWSKMPRSTMETGRKPLKTRWIFKIKNEVDGSLRYKARLVVKGYTQVAGIDYTETFSPVATDVTNRVVMAYALHQEDWELHVVDFDAAFLNAEVKEDLFIEVPEGLSKIIDGSKYVMKLNKAAYGIVQAPREWQKKLSDELVKQGLIASRVDPCLFYLKDKKGQVIGMVSVYVDDVLIAGSPKTITLLKNKMKESFAMKDLGKLSKLLGVQYKLKVDELGTYYDVSLEDYIAETYKEMLEVARRYGLPNVKGEIPGTPGKTLEKTTVEQVIAQPEYRRCVGKLLFGMRKAWPHVCNAVRELSGHLDAPSLRHWQEAYRVCEYLWKHRNLHLKLRKPRELRVIAYADASFAPPNEGRKSIAGLLVTVGGCLVQWMSRAESSTALSSTEAEYIAMSMCAQEVKFVSMLLNEMSKETKTPSIIREDNTGALFLIENAQIGSRTKHIDTRYHFVRDMVRNEELQTVYVRSELNCADLCTKNLPRDKYEKHAKNILNGDMGRILREDVKMCERGDTVSFPSRDEKKTKHAVRGTGVRRHGPQK
jgi:hypothetical protein